MRAGLKPDSIPYHCSMLLFFPFSSPEFAASSADASSLLSSLSPLSHITTLDLGVVYNRYPFPPPQAQASAASCDLDVAAQPANTFWDVSSHIRLAPVLNSAAAKLYARSLLALRQLMQQNSGLVDHAADRSLCVHWRRTDFKTCPNFFSNLRFLALS